MADPTLAPRAALGGHSEDFGGAALAERADLALVSIAGDLAAGADLAAALEAGFGAAPPATGESALSADGAVRLLGMAPDQIFAMFADQGPDAKARIDAALHGAGATTDQTDAWAALALRGPRAREALARICPLDLHPAAFPEGRVARTLMEHISAVILREGADSFLLLSARSAARSFLHAVETSIRNLPPEAGAEHR